MSFTQERRQLQFGNVAHVLLSKRARIQKLQEDKKQIHCILTGLGVVFDEKSRKLKHASIPEANRPRCRQLLQEILDIQEEINRLHLSIPAIQAEADFLQTAD